MHTGHPQLAACSTPSPPTPAQNAVIIDSETEPESETQSDNELDNVIENQLGLPGFQCGVIESSPPPVDANIICNELNKEGEFFSKRGLQILSFRLSKTTGRAQISADEGKDSRVMNTDLVLLLGDNCKVRRTSSLWCRSTKLSLKKTKIEVHVEGSYRSNPTININIKQAHSRGKKHEREIEGIDGTTEIHVQVKKTRK